MSELPLRKIPLLILTVVTKEHRLRRFLPSLSGIWPFQEFGRTRCRIVSLGKKETSKRPSGIGFIQTFHGEMTQVTWEEMLLEVRRVTSMTGSVEDRGSTKEWRASLTDWETYHLTATSADGVTKVRLSHGYLGMKVATILFSFLLGPAIVLSLLKGTVGLLPLELAPVAIILLIPAYFISRELIGRKARVAEAEGVVFQKFVQILSRKEPFENTEQTSSMRSEPSAVYQDSTDGTWRFLSVSFPLLSSSDKSEEQTKALGESFIIGKYK